MTRNFILYNQSVFSAPQRRCGGLAIRMFEERWMDMSAKQAAASVDTPRPEAAAPDAAAAAPRRKTPKSAKAPARRGRPPLSPEIYIEAGGRQYNVTDIVERVKADYRLTHKVGVQSCKIYIKPEDGAAYYVVNKVEGKLDL